MAFDDACFEVLYVRVNFFTRLKTADKVVHLGETKVETKTTAGTFKRL